MRSMIVLYGRTSHHKDCVKTKIERLKLHMRKWERRIASIARKGVISNVSSENENTNKSQKGIKLKKTGPGIAKYPPTSEQIPGWEEAGNPPIRIKLKRVGPGVTKHMSQ